MGVVVDKKGKQMFKCQNEFCGKIVPPRQPVNRIVTECRQKEYTNDIVKRERVVGVKESSGSEIVKEISVCPKCFSRLTGKRPKLADQRKRPDTRKQPGFNARPPRKKWQNPKRTESSTTHQRTHNSDSSVSSTRKPVVEKVNPIPIIK